MKIAIIKNAGSLQANLILQGVYGTFNVPVTQDGQEPPASGNFTIAPEFNQVSHLFSLIQGGTAPVSVAGVQVIDVPEEIFSDVRAQFMSALGSRWMNMYRDVTPRGMDTITARMLEGESAIVQRGINNFLASMGMRTFQVVAKIEAESVYRSNEYRNEAELARNMRPIEGAAPTIISVQDTAEIVERPEALLPAAGTGDTDPNAVDHIQPWHHEGHRAAGDLYITYTVAARSVEKAAQLSHYLLTEKSVREIDIAQTLTPTSFRVENVRQGTEINYAHEGEHDDDDGADFDRPRVAY
jgi:hypothetical protein